jgi:hypothetical protein
MLAALWRLLDRGQRRRLVLLQWVALWNALITLVGVAAIVPFLRVLTDPSGGVLGALATGRRAAKP